MRKPIVADMFYEGDAERLKKQISDCFLDKKLGPSGLPSDEKKKLIGVIAPHAGYQFSGMCQAFSYKEIAATDADTFVILGTSHEDFPTAALIFDDFETPLGIVPVDKDFCRALITKGLVKEDKKAHASEHSIEVQLPFLQFVCKDLKIVPIVCGHDVDYKGLGEAIAGYIKQLKKKAVVICSSDFTHYGVNYAYMPFSDDVKENMEKLDLGAVEFIEKLDAEGFLKYVNDNEATICGAFAVAVFISACKELNAKKAELLKYYSSGDVIKDWSSCVGYVSLAVR